MSREYQVHEFAKLAGGSRLKEATSCGLSLEDFPAALRAIILSMKLRTILLMLLIFSLTVMASVPETTLTISVTNEFDKPVENAAVILDFLGSHQVMKLGKRKPIHWEVHTNLQGIAHFPPIPQGTIQLQVITKKYQTFGKKFDIDTDAKTVEVKLNSPQQQYSAHPPLKPADAPKP